MLLRKACTSGPPSPTMLRQYHCIVPSTATRGLHSQTARRFSANASTHRTGWALAGLVGLASLILTSSPVHMDGDDGQTSRRSRGDLSSLTDSSTSHFSYSYYERAVGEVSDGQPTSLRLLESAQLPGGQTGIHRYDNAQIARYVQYIQSRVRCVETDIYEH